MDQPFSNEPKADGQFSKRVASRQSRLDDYPGEGEPPEGLPCDLLCEDHVGMYRMPYPCVWVDGGWRNHNTGEPVMAGVAGWRVRKA